MPRERRQPAMKLIRAVSLFVVVAMSFAAIGAGLWWVIVDEGPHPAVIGAILALAVAQIATVSARLSEGPLFRRRRKRKPDAGESRRGSGPAPEAKEPALSGEEKAPETSDQRDLLLEPIVRLSEQRTAYYRATLGQEADGGPLSQQMQRLEAARDGRIATLDEELFHRVAPVVRHFNAKGKRTGVFCALSAEALADEKFLERLVEFLRGNADIAGGIVAEISQPTLAGLSPEGHKGLAYLAQLGATFSLSEARPDSPDLDLLTKLGFKFIDMDMGAVMRAHGWQGFQPGGAVEAFARRAEEAGFTVIAARVESAEDLEAVEDFATLARGRLFAPPRRVREDIGAEVPAVAAA
ncbi:MAG: EAL domain-containing protein [Parvibaculaceae bacterium]